MSLDMDSILVNDLQLPHGITTSDVWGKLKEQPATVSLTLLLGGDGFHTAANKDELDQSTIHYGELSKRIRSANVSGQTVDEFLKAAEECIKHMATKAEDNFILGRASISLELPKATMYGSKVKVYQVLSYDKTGKIANRMRYHEVHDVKIMVLVGVNEYERQAEQPLMVDVNVFRYVEGDTSLPWPSMKELAGLEQKVVELIKPTTFETLETLADYAAKKLQEQYLAKVFPKGCMLRLKISKPRAIPFADAPAVEVTRNTIEGLRRCGAKEPAGKMEDVKIVKPYA